MSSKHDALETAREMDALLREPLRAYLEGLRSMPSEQRSQLHALDAGARAALSILNKKKNDG